MRTEDLWQVGLGGGYIEPVDPSGFNILLKGSNRYLNFGSISGTSGYGIRDNAGTIQVKNLAGAWTDIGSSGLSETFESVSKNIKAYPYEIAYAGGDVDTITYDLGSGLQIVKTFGYTSGDVTSVVLSGDTPTGVDLTKTISYLLGNVDNIVYS